MRFKALLMIAAFGGTSLLEADSINIIGPSITPGEFYQDSLAESLLPGTTTWPPPVTGTIASEGEGSGGLLGINPWVEQNPYLVILNQQKTFEGFLLQQHPGIVIWEGIPAPFIPPLGAFSSEPTVPLSSPPIHDPPGPRPHPEHHEVPPVPEPGYLLLIGLGLAVIFTGRRRVIRWHQE